MDENVLLRHEVARMVLELYDRRIPASRFFAEIDRLPVDSDPEVAELVALIRRAQARSWFFGVGRRQVQDDGKRVGELVKRLAQ